MNKQDFYIAFKKGVTCAITCLIIFFSAIFCFYTGYKFGRERVLDNNSSDILSSSVQTQSLSLQPMDTVVNDPTFVGSNILLPVSFMANENLSSDHCVDGYCSFSFSFSSDTLSVSKYSLFRNIFTRPVYSFRINELNSHDPDVTVFNNYTKGSWVPNFFWVRFNYGDYNVLFSYFFDYYCDLDFNFNVVSCQIESIDGFRGDSRYFSTIVSYFDSNGKEFKFIVPCYITTYTQSLRLSPRRYLFAGALSDNEIYQAGYDAGYNNGDLAGRDAGYNIGYNSGYQDGELTGYNNGINTANTYSFSNLLTAVVEAPVNVFINLLDFDIMGYNLLNIVLGLLTLAIVVLVIKLCLGGK